jgi:hypothetical protein
VDLGGKVQPNRVLFTGYSENLELEDLLTSDLVTNRLRSGQSTWSLTSLQQRLLKTGGRIIQHARYY